MIFKQIKLKNNGKNIWPRETYLQCKTKGIEAKLIKLPQLDSSKETLAMLVFKQPNKSGKYDIEWNLVGKKNEKTDLPFEGSFTIRFEVKASSQDSKSQEVSEGSKYLTIIEKFYEQAKELGVNKEYIVRKVNAEPSITYERLIEQYSF